jgi:hypothetical protein
MVPADLTNRAQFETADTSRLPAICDLPSDVIVDAEEPATRSRDSTPNSAMRSPRSLGAAADRVGGQFEHREPDGLGPTPAHDSSTQAASPAPFLENFVLMELARELTWNDERASLWHYRTKDRVEVDAVLESADGRIIGIEVKAGATLHKHDFAGLLHLQDRLGDRFVAGFVLYSGQHSLPSGDRLRALPIDALWQAAPQRRTTT